jgi:D-tyrosyl-tRNA(Tyr) deacylase
VEKTLEKVECAILDWKGIKGEHKSKLIEMLNEVGLPVQKV